MPRQSKMPSNRRLRDASHQELPWYRRLPTWIWTSIASALVIMLILVAMASYGWGNISRLHLPVSPLLSLLAVVLPVGNFLGISHALVATKGIAKHLKTFRTNFYVTILLVLDTILATIAATHLPPEMLNCHLGERWTKMWRSKDSEHIKHIQDALKCCGFKSTKDMSYPFPVGDKKPSCPKEYHRDVTRACFLPWRKHEQTSAILYLVVGLVLGFLKLALMAYLNRHDFSRKEGGLSDEQVAERVEEIDSDVEDIPREGIRRLEPANETTPLLNPEHQHHNGTSSSNAEQS